ncbi:MAG: hypothetical protein IT338_20245 [Thermomicrobiales bacterium]|nr:hypothetical protein [Thermomicrobiales bacterium]
MGDFGAQFGEWHEFFATLAGIAGTLTGLLFVALGLNPAIMADTSPAGQRVLAGQTFHSLIVLLLIGLMGLVPDDSGTALMITLVIVGAQGLLRVTTDLRKVRHDPDPHWRGNRAVGLVISPTLAYATCLWLALTIWRQDADSLGWAIAIVLLLMISAAASCWDLLKWIGETHRPGDG